MNVGDEYGLPAGAQASQLYTNPQSLWGEQRPADRQNRSLQATIESMVGSIEPGENREDLLKDERHTAGTIGITMSSDSNALTPMHVMSVLVGGPAYISGQIAKGDEVVAVDGKRAADKESLLDQIRTPDYLGSTVLLTVKRGNMQHEVPLVRTSAAHVEDVSTTFGLLKQLSSLVEQMAPAEDFLSTLQMLILHSVDMERNRLEYEQELAQRVAGIQDRLQRKEALVSEMIQEITRLKSTPSFNSGNVRAFNAQLGIPDTSPPQAPQNVAFVPTQEEIEQLERERAEMWEIKKRNEYLEGVVANATQEMANLHNKVEETLLAKNELFEEEMKKKTEELYALFQEQLARKSEEVDELCEKLAAAEQALAVRRRLSDVEKQREQRVSAELLAAEAPSQPAPTHAAAPAEADAGDGRKKTEAEDSVMRHLSEMISRVDTLKDTYPSPTKKDAKDTTDGSAFQHQIQPQPAPNPSSSQTTARQVPFPAQAGGQAAPAHCCDHPPTSTTDTNPAPKPPVNMVPSPPPKAYPHTPPASSPGPTILKLQPVVQARPRPTASGGSGVSLRLPSQASDLSPRTGSDSGKGGAQEEAWGLHTVLRQLGHSGSSGSSLGGPETRARKAGIGMLLHKPLGTEFPYVKDIVPGGAADRNGRIQKGEILLAIDQTPVGGLPLNTVVEKISGVEGTPITLTLQRDAGSGKDVLSVSLIRESTSAPDAPVPSTIQATAETVFRPWDAAASDVDLTRQVSPRPVEAPPDSSKMAHHGTFF